MIEYVKGNLLDSKADVLVNTVNCVGVMGKGLALQFKINYPDMFAYYRSVCLQERLHIGSLLVWYAPGVVVVNFPTKIHWAQPSQYNYIEQGLRSLADLLRKWSAKKRRFSVALPALGCANGGLSWPKVQKLIEDQLKDVPATFYVYEPYEV